MGTTKDKYGNVSADFSVCPDLLGGATSLAAVTKAVEMVFSLNAWVGGSILAD